MRELEVHFWHHRSSADDCVTFNPILNFVERFQTNKSLFYLFDYRISSHLVGRVNINQTGSLCEELSSLKCIHSLTNTLMDHRPRNKGKSQSACSQAPNIRPLALFPSLSYSLQWVLCHHHWYEYIGSKIANLQLGQTDSPGMSSKKDIEFWW